VAAKGEGGLGGAYQERGLRAAAQRHLVLAWASAGGVGGAQHGDVLAHFRVSKGDQFRKGGVVARSGAALRVLLQLLDSQPSLARSAFLMTHVFKGAAEVVSQAQARKALRAMVRACGVTAEEERLYKLHSGRIGGLSAMAAANASPAVMMVGGRWASDSWKVYLRTSDAVTAVISEALDEEDALDEDDG
jgi:hypothetical protein